MNSSVSSPTGATGADVSTGATAGVAEALAPTMGSLEPQPAARMSVPILARGWALNVVGALAVVTALKLGAPFFIPLLCGILIAFVLDPIVDRLQRLKVPRALGATLVMLLLMCAMSWGAYALYGPAQSLVEKIPGVVRQVALSSQGSEGSVLTRLRTLIADTERAAQGLPSHGETASPAPARGPLRAAARHSEAARSPATPPAAGASAPDTPAAGGAGGFRYQEWLLASSMSIMTFAGQFGMVVFLVFFLLIAGDTFKRKLVRIAGPTFAQKKITVKILDDIDLSMQRYLWVLFTTNVAVGVLTGLMLWLLGFQSAAGLGLAAGLLHLIPYAGSAITAILLLVVGLLQFETLNAGLAAAGGSLVIATLVGIVVTTWMTGRMTRMNATAVFVSLLFFGWLWGAWGLLLGLPLIVMVKTVADHVEELKSLSELLSD